MNKLNWIKSNKELWTTNLLTKEVFCIYPIIIKIIDKSKRKIRKSQQFGIVIYKSPIKVRNPKRLYFDHKYQAKEFVENYITNVNYAKRQLGYK
jgi:hypothetical protein